MEKLLAVAAALEKFKIKKPFKPERFEGLHPVYLTLFFIASISVVRRALAFW